MTKVLLVVGVLNEDDVLRGNDVNRHNATAPILEEDEAVFHSFFQSHSELDRIFAAKATLVANVTDAASGKIDVCSVSEMGCSK